MASFVKFQTFVEDLAKGVHNFTSDSTCTLTIALCAAANAPVATNSVLADLTQISYTNLSARVVTGVSAEHTAGTMNLLGTDLILAAIGVVAAFRYVVLYNDDPTSPADPLIGFYDYGSSISLLNLDTLTIDFDPTNGILSIT